jgi:hypothetical protein
MRIFEVVVKLKAIIALGVQLLTWTILYNFQVRLLNFLLIIGELVMNKDTTQYKTCFWEVLFALSMPFSL